MLFIFNFVIIALSYEEEYSNPILPSLTYPGFSPQETTIISSGTYFLTSYVFTHMYTYAHTLLQLFWFVIYRYFYICYLMHMLYKPKETSIHSGSRNVAVFPNCAQNHLGKRLRSGSPITEGIRQRGVEGFGCLTSCCSLVLLTDCCIGRLQANSSHFRWLVYPAWYGYVNYDLQIYLL